MISLREIGGSVMLPFPPPCSCCGCLGFRRAWPWNCMWKAVACGWSLDQARATHWRFCWLMWHERPQGW